MVKLARDTNTGRDYAMKIIKKEGNAEMVERWIEMTEQEVLAIKSINHPNIVNMVESQEDAQYVKKNGEQYPIMYIV